MLVEQEAQDLIIKFIELRKIAEETKTPSDINNFQKHERICIEKFSYLVTMRAGRYKAFHNYEDLVQEGYEALVKSMKNYDPKKGNFFWWSHKYIDTKISRSANLHTTIRFPLKFAKANAPHRENKLPPLYEEKRIPEIEMEAAQTNYFLNGAMTNLTDNQRIALDLAYGLSGDKPLSISKICKQMNISRSTCIKSINSALAALKETVKI